ncbi:hypothetical protein, partial [Alkalithermobacter paradoxus]
IKSLAALIGSNSYDSRDVSYLYHSRIAFFVNFSSTNYEAIIDYDYDMQDKAEVLANFKKVISFFYPRNSSSAWDFVYTPIKNKAFNTTATRTFSADGRTMTYRYNGGVFQVYVHRK